MYQYTALINHKSFPMKKLYLILISLFASFLASSQTSTWEVYALKYASLTHLSASENTAAKDSVHVDFMIWLIKGNGKNILVDAGFLYGIDETKDFDGINYLQADSTQQKITIRPEDITDIIVSHQHWDRFDFKDLFPNAHVWMQKYDYNYATQTSWQKGGANAAFNRKEVRNLIDVNAAGRVTLIEGDNKEIIPGIKLYIGSGEKFNPQYVLVKTASDNIFLASDNVWLYYNLEHTAAVPTYGAFSAIDHIKAMQLMKTLQLDVKFIPAGQNATALSKFAVATEGVIKIK